MIPTNLSMALSSETLTIIEGDSSNVADSSSSFSTQSVHRDIQEEVEEESVVVVGSFSDTDSSSSLVSRHPLLVEEETTTCAEPPTDMADVSLECGPSQHQQPPSSTHTPRDNPIPTIVKADVLSIGLIESLQQQIQELSLEKSRLQVENSKLSQKQEEYIQQQSILQNRLNESKKKETQKTRLVSELQEEIHQFQVQVQRLSTQLSHVTQTKEALQENITLLKQQCLETVQAAEHAWKEERALNEERKEKIKGYLETKGQELVMTQKQLETYKVDALQSQEALTSVRKKIDELTQIHYQDEGRIRELIKENTRLKKEYTTLSQLGNTLEIQLVQTTQESIQHENKRKEAKQELYTLLRKLQVEQVLVENYKEILQLSLIPKAKSQQQLLQTCIKDFQSTITTLQKKFFLYSSTLSNMDHHPQQEEVEEDGKEYNDTILGQDKTIHSSSSSFKRNKVGMSSNKDTTTLISLVEQETQLVSRGILEIIHLVEKIQSLLKDSDHYHDTSSSSPNTTMSTTRTCLNSITSLLHHHTSTSFISTTTNMNHNTATNTTRNQYNRTSGSNTSGSNEKNMTKRVVEHRRILPRNIPNFSSYHETGVEEEEEEEV